MRKVSVYKNKSGFFLMEKGCRKLILSAFPLQLSLGPLGQLYIYSRIQDAKLISLKN